MDKLFAFLLFFFQISFLFGQPIPIFQWTGLSSSNFQLFATQSFSLLDFSNGCIRVENGLRIWKKYSAGGTFTYPCVQTSDKIQLQLHLYPNPASIVATIKAIVYTDLHRVISLTITDEIGRLIFREKYRLYDLQQGVALPVNYFLSGIYFVVVSGDGVSGFKRFVKITK